MENKEYNPGFAFYQDFFTSIECLPLEQQKEICYALAKYGITGEMVDSKEMPLGHAFTNTNKRSIDNSVDRWKINQNKANYKIDNNMSRDYYIAKLINQGKNSREIAEEISELYGKITDSAIRRTDPWKEKGNADFVVKWLGERNCENSQNYTESTQCENDVNVNSQEREFCENSQNFTKKEQNNVYLSGAASIF